MSDVLSVLICAQAVCKYYQQTTPVGKERQSTHKLCVCVCGGGGRGGGGSGNNMSHEKIHTTLVSRSGISLFIKVYIDAIG